MYIQIDLIFQKVIINHYIQLYNTPRKYNGWVIRHRLAGIFVGFFALVISDHDYMNRKTING